jgi:hypothetical protein
METGHLAEQDELQLLSDLHIALGPVGSQLSNGLNVGVLNGTSRLQALPSRLAGRAGLAGALPDLTQPVTVCRGDAHQRFLTLALFDGGPASSSARTTPAGE